MAVKLPNPKYIPKSYEQMQYPGQRVQIDVKFVPASCLVGEAAVDGGYYQYTFIDEFSRFRYLEAFKEHSSYSSAEFIRHCVKRFPYAIECVQTDNGSEFTNSMNNSKTIRPTLFEKTLKELCIQHKRIKVYTPRHNGILTNINSYARGTAKEAVSDGYTYKPSNNSYVRGLEALDSVGIPIADYYTYYKDISNIKKKYDTTDERKKRVIEYINEHKTLSTEQKNYLWHETAHYDSKSPWESSYNF